jgi:flagellar export protein FliJ
MKTGSRQRPARASARWPGGISRPFWPGSVTALEQQRNVVEQARAAHQAAIVVWREAAKRAHVVDTLQERWQVEESREEGRRDQRDNDELSQQLRFNRETKS